MLRVLGIILVSSCVVLTGTTASASTNGLLLNDDTAGVHYVGDISDTFLSNSRLDAEALYSQGPDPRNLLLRTGLEFNNYSINFENNSQIIPKATVLWADFLDASVPAFAVGGLVRSPLTETRKFDVWAELLAAPSLTTLSDGKYLWSFKLQLDYPLAQDAAINLGYRNIKIKLEDERQDAFDQGLYFGLSTRF